MSNNIGAENNYENPSVTEETEVNDNSSSVGEKFNLIEYAIGKFTNRKHFFEINNVEDYCGKKEIYHSIFIHSNEIKDYIRGNNSSIEGYEGCVGTYHDIIIDIDCKNNLEESQKITQGIVQKIESLYEADLDCMRVNFSGSKGFHIHLPVVLFGDFEPSENLPTHIRSIVQELTAGYENIDLSIYRTTGLIRELNTVNGKSGLVAIPLAMNELFSLTIDEIKNLAKSPREVDYLDAEELLPNPLLVELKNKFLLGEDSIGDKLEDQLEKTDIATIMKGDLSEGERHNGLVKLVSHFIHYNVPDQTIYTMADLFNKSNNPPKDIATVKKEVDGILKQYGKIKGDYWTVCRNKKGYIKVDINHYHLIRFLETNGFAKLYLANSFAYVKDVNNRIKEKISPEIKDFILSSIKNGNLKGLTNEFKEEILNELISHNGKYLSDKVFECVESREMELLKDTAKLGRVFFKNCFVEVTADDMRTVPYSELKGLIWEDQIINNDFDLLTDGDQSMFREFLWNVSDKNELRFNSLVSAMGYLLHGYKNSSNAKAIVFCDEKVSDDPNGRTGKSLASVALSKMKDSVRLDGKLVNFKDRFVFQQVERSTQIIEFNDVRKSFDFEGLFSVVTDAINVEKKNGHKFAIEFQDAPKVLISTNYTITGTGDSFTDRLFEIEFAPYYSSKHKPVDDFGCVFFEGWDQEEWNRFYNFMLWCEQYYLKNGLVVCEKVNLLIRKLMDSTSSEFMKFADEYIKVGIEYDKNISYSLFRSMFPDYDKVRQRTFTKWLTVYAEYKGYEFITREANGNGYFTFKPGSIKSLFN